MSEPQSPWHVVQRLQEYRGEERANLLRMLGIGVFYVIHVINRRGLDLGFVQLPRVEDIDERFHLAMTAIAAGWVMVCIGALIAMKNQRFPPTIKYGTTILDAIFLTGALTIADGPSSTLIVGYFLLIAIAPLRFSPRLVLVATASAMVGYLFVVGHTLAYRPALAGQRYQHIMVLAALWLSGVVMSQMVHAVKRAAHEFAQRREAQS